MAFATSNVIVRNSGSYRTLTGNWSCVATDAPGTIAIGSGNVIAFDFDPALSTGPSEKPHVTSSLSSGVTTLTINHHQTVTNGKFKIDY